MNARTANPTRRAPFRSHPCLVIAGLAALAVVATEPARAQAPAEPAVPPSFDCRATEVVGVPEAEAATTVSIACDELARVSRREGRYGVAVRPLGKAFILSVSRLPQGDTRSLTLEGLEETPLAATRLAEALVLGRPVEKTQRVDNLTAAETRQPREKKGSRKLALGVVGLSASGQDAGTGTGFSFGWVHEAPLWAALGELRWASSSEREDHLSIFALSAGMRRYLSRQDVAPFVGGGLERLSISSSGYGGNTSRSADSLSLAPYLEVGIQAMRLSRARLTAAVRVHVATSSVEGTIQDWSACGGDDYYACDEPRPISEYVLPVTLDLSVSF